MAQSSSGVVAICFVLPVFQFVHDIMFLYNASYSGMNFTTKDQCHLNLLICCTVKHKSISYY